MDYRRLASIVEYFAGRKIMVVGDLMVDRRIFGEVNRISPGAPIPILDVVNEDFKPSGAATLAKCIAELGGQPNFLGGVGDDEEGRWLIKELGLQAKEGCVLTSPERPTACTVRLISKGQQLFRFDRGKDEPFSQELYQELVGYIEDNMEGVDGIILSDHERGLVTDELRASTISIARKYGKPVLADARAGRPLSYLGVNLLRTNEDYSSRAAGVSIVNDTSLRLTGMKLLTLLECEAVLITRGKGGSVLFEPPERDARIAALFDPPMKVTYVPATDHEAKDSSGVGDIVTSTLALAIAGGGSKLEAAELANFAAGIKVQKVGAWTITREELADWVQGRCE